MVQKAPKQMYELVQGLEPDYRTWRRRWPLWTYNQTAWAEHPGGWLGRFLFGPDLLLEAWKSWRPNVDADGAPFVPFLTRAYARAVELQIRKHLGPPLEHAAAQLVDSLRDAMLDENADGDTLLRRLIRHRAETLHGDGPRESRERLGKDLLEKVGLLAHSGASTSLADRTVKALDTEAREIVNAVPAADVENTVRFVARTMELDPVLALRPMERERVRRGQPKRAHTAALALHFPFLTPGELDLLTTEREATPAKLAYRLVTNRLEGDYTYGAYRNLLSRA